MISLGKWKTGSIVPSAKKLSDILSVSKTTVVKCMNLLIKEGLIESQGQLGYSVTNKYESIKLRSKSQFDILKLAKINIDIATRLSMVILFRIKEPMYLLPTIVLCWTFHSMHVHVTIPSDFYLKPN